ncbi:GntR family transcriptional regulator [Acidaminococcus timonensis]|uniref:GntR family transcriptional regulator n=1 Tax=Acidaminococcus timonensis TaxID=1871002 RepID=UPI0025F98EBB|nr:GntR family transcriptional regulator [Acidaminococcus timonensis]
MTKIPYRLGKIKRQSLAEEAYRYLKDQILSGNIRQGDMITEQTVADILHMSRTPVKNALSRLESENFVTTLGGRGTLVNVLSIADMRDIYSVRIALEVLALDTAINNLSAKELEEIHSVFTKSLKDYKKDKTSLSAEEMYQLDNIFHDLFIEHTSNHYIRKLMPSISERIQVGQLQAYIMTDTFETSTLQHLKIIEALEAKDLPEAKRLLHAHLEWSYNVMFEAMIKNGKRISE